MYAAMSKFTVANDKTAKVKRTFQERPHLVDRSPDFVSMDVISPIDKPNEIALLTFWETEDIFKNWHRSLKFRKAHKWISKGLKLVPKSTQLRPFEYICS